MSLASSLCAACAHVREIRSERGSVFAMCTRGLRDASFAKYPMQPVRACLGFEPRSGDDGPAAPNGGSPSPAPRGGE